MHLKENKVTDMLSDSLNDKFKGGIFIQVLAAIVVSLQSGQYGIIGKQINQNK